MTGSKTWHRLMFVAYSADGCHCGAREAGQTRHSGTPEGCASIDRRRPAALHLHLAEGQLVLQRPEDAVAQLRALGSSVSPARSLVEELLAERRIDAASE